MDNLLFQLKEPLDYSVKGDWEKTATIELGPPSYKCFDQATQLSQFVMAAVLASTRFEHLAKEKETDKDKDDLLNADAVKFILMSAEDKFEDIHACFRKLACKVGTVAEDVPLIDSHFSKMSYDDNIRIVCEYVANFILPSLF
jgi:hypothetical protein